MAAEAATKTIKKLIPMFDRVLVLRAETNRKTRSGIVLPKKAQKKAMHGTVVATGPGYRSSTGEFIPTQIKVGDKVLLPRYGGTEIDLEEDREYHLFRESDILAKLEI